MPLSPQLDRVSVFTLHDESLHSTHRMPDLPSHLNPLYTSSPQLPSSLPAGELVRRPVVRRAPVACVLRLPTAIPRRPATGTMDTADGQWWGKWGKECGADG